MEQTPKTSSKRSELQMARSMCWHCQSEITGEYFCDQCVKVQPLSKDLDYFACLGLPRLLKIDPAALESRFYQLSRTFHPDFFQSKTPTEQQISLGNAALLNSAYRTLKDPIRRAEYLVQLEAGSVKDIRSSPPADLFEEILSLQEDLEQFRSLGPDGDESEIEPLRRKLEADRASLEQRQRDMEAQLIGFFDKWDDLQGRPDDEGVRAEKQLVLKRMREILSNRTYLRNIVTDLVNATSQAGA
ncbi:Fe-S protein assembly co-chaperone HscB [Candidatus Nitrospira bockiana]